MSPAGVREFLLAFADDEHLMGQQHTEWIGVAPFLEEDLAFSSIGQDELGHAALLYELVLELDGIEITDEAVDDLAYRRSADEYRSCHLVEASVSDWAEALVRHWVYDTFEAMRWHLVADSSIRRLGSIAQRALQEEAFHRMHADALLDRLLPVSEARGRLTDALEGVVPLLGGLCEPPAGEAAAIVEGVSAGSTADCAETIAAAIAERFGHEANTATSAGNQQRLPHGEIGRLLAPLMLRMREVLDFDPEAKW